MRLVSLHIENFGTLHDVDERFDAGLNVRLHPNGYGKSTLAVFIKAMLYGLPSSTRRSLIENERKRYQPWQGGAYGGSLDIEVDGSIYRIERLFDAKDADDTLTVLSVETGEVVREEWAAAPGERLFGVGMAAYERSTYLSQRPDDITKDGMDGIHTKLNGLVDAADDLGNYERAITALNQRRQYYALLKGRGGAVADTEDALKSVEERVEAALSARATLDATRKRIREAEQAIAECNTILNELRTRELALGRAREAKAIEERIAALTAEENTLREQISTLRESLGGVVPTEAMIEALQTALATRNTLRQGGKAVLDEFEAQELLTLERQFPQGMPSDAQTAELRELANQYNHTALLAASAGADPVGIPITADELASHRQVLVQTEQQYTALVARRDTANRTAPSTSGKAFLPMLMGIVALGLLIGGIWLPALLTVGGVMALATVATVLIVHTRRSQAQHARADQRAALDAEIAAMEPRLRTARAAVAAAEAGSRFSVLWQQTAPQRPCPRATDAPLSVERLITQSERLRTLTAKHQRLSASAEQNHAALEKAQSTVRALLASMPGAPEDDTQALRWLTEQRGRLLDAAERYDSKQKELASLRAQYDTESETHRASLSLIETTDESELQQARTAMQSKLVLWSETRLREQQSAERLRAVADEVEELENERAHLTALLDEQKNNLDAILQAEKYLKLAREHLSGRYLSTMQQRFGHYMSLLTGKETPTFTMDGQFRVKLRAAGAGRDSDAFSVGVRDLIALCERLALLDAMFEGERPFLVLDDPFANFDDDTIARAHALLPTISDRYQILYLTCRSERIPQQLS